MRRTAGLALLLAAASGLAYGRDYRAPRTPWGAPDFEGVWTNASFTPMQRPKEFKSLVVSPEAARAYEARLAEHHGAPASPGTPGDVDQADSEFPDNGDGLARIRGQLRTSLVVDPADGRLPYTAEARSRLHVDREEGPSGFDGPEARPGPERCTTSTGASPPLIASYDANLFQVFEAPGYVTILSEKNHDARILPIGGRRDPHAPATWQGNSVARWEGDTLVVETEGFRQPLIDRAPFLYESGDAKVVERFTRTSPTEMLYEFAVTDPKTFTQTWRGEMLFRTAKGPIYEYACHEGNYSMVNDLQAARQADRAAPAAANGKVLAAGN